MKKEQNFEIHFAPVQGQTDAVYRNLHAGMFRGVKAYYTPFIRLEQGNTFRPKDLRDCAPEHNTVPRLVPQVLGGEPEELRLGWQDAGECLALLPALNAAPLSAVVLHARLGVQGYKGETDPEAFGAFLQGCAHPLYYNGDVRTTEDIRAARERFPGIRGVMIGRGLLANPALAEEFEAGQSLAPEERQRRFRDFHDSLLAAYAARLQGDAHLLKKMQGFWEEFMPWTDRKLLKRIHKCSKMNAYREAVNAVFAAERERE